MESRTSRTPRTRCEAGWTWHEAQAGPMGDSGDPTPGPHADDDVIDADYTEEKPEDKGGES